MTHMTQVGTSVFGPGHAAVKERAAQAQFRPKNGGRFLFIEMLQSMLNLPFPKISLFRPWDLDCCGLFWIVWRVFWEFPWFFPLFSWGNPTESQAPGGGPPAAVRALARGARGAGPAADAAAGEPLAAAGEAMANPWGMAWGWKKIMGKIMGKWWENDGCLVKFDNFFFFFKYMFQKVLATLGSLGLCSSELPEMVTSRWPTRSASLSQSVARGSATKESMADLPPQNGVIYQQFTSNLLAIYGNFNGENLGEPWDFLGLTFGLQAPLLGFQIASSFRLHIVGPEWSDLVKGRLELESLPIVGFSMIFGYLSCFKPFSLNFSHIHRAKHMDYHK